MSQDRQNSRMLHSGKICHPGGQEQLFGAKQTWFPGHDVSHTAGTQTTNMVKAQKNFTKWVINIHHRMNDLNTVQVYFNHLGTNACDILIIVYPSE